MKTKRKQKKRGSGRVGVSTKIAEFKEKYPEMAVQIQESDRKPGTPAHWKKDYTRMIFWMALAGLQDAEIANIIGIQQNLLDHWKKRYPDFKEALMKGRVESVAVASYNMFRAGNGFEHMAEKIIPNRVKEYHPDTGRVISERTEILRVPYTKKYPPNVAALTKFLAAKYPEVWGDRSEVVHTGEVNHKVKAADLTSKQLKTLQQVAANAAKKDKKKNKKKKR